MNAGKMPMPSPRRSRTTWKTLNHGLERRTAVLEEEMEICGSRLDGFGQELKVVLDQISVLNTWIKQQFGIDLINKGVNVNVKCEVESEEDGDDNYSDDETSSLSVPEPEPHSPNPAPARRFQIGQSSPNYPDPLTPYIIEQAVRLKTLTTSSVVVVGNEFREDIERQRLGADPLDLDSYLELGQGHGNEESSSGPGVRTRKQEVNRDVPLLPGKPAKRKRARKNGATFQKCRFCQKQFQSIKHLETHLRVHTQEKPFTCEHCPQTFSLRGNYAAHLKIKHTDSGRLLRFPCHFCSKKFSRKDHWRNHELTHTGEKDFKCQQCDKAFTLKHHLVRHLAELHGLQKSYTCQVCGEGFRLRSLLSQHLLVHGTD